MWIYYQDWGLFWIDAWQPVGNCLRLWGYQVDAGVCPIAFEIR